MQNYKKFTVMVTIAIVILLLISHKNWNTDNLRDSGRFVNYESSSTSPEPTQKQRLSKKTVAALRNPATKVNRTPSSGVKEAELPLAVRVNRTPSSGVKEAELPLAVRVNRTPSSGVQDAWFRQAWVRSTAVQQPKVFVGDQPLFPGCSGRQGDGMRYSFIDAKNYIPESKNPCWFDDPIRKKGFRCIPYFYIAGVAKCGTTDLYRRLRLHPDIMKGTMKEYHFWDRERFGNVETTETGEILHVNRKPWTFRQYTDLITGPSDLRLVLDDIRVTGKSVKLFGDGSPSYLWDILKWQLLEGNEGCMEPRLVIGQQIRHIYPAAKMILIFRHPTTRLYSRFLSRIWRTNYLKGSNSDTFHRYVKRGIQLYRDCFKRWSIRQCAYNFTLYDEAVVRLVEGMYPVFMADWLRIWPREQMLLLRNEDYGADLQGTVLQVFDFLGVESIPNVAETLESVYTLPNGTTSKPMAAKFTSATLNGSDLAVVVDHQMSNVGSEYDKVGPMKPETVKILDQFYQPFVEQFADLLQDRRFLWKDTYPPKAA